MNTRSWIGRITSPTATVVVALTVALLVTGTPSAAHAMSTHESVMRGGDAHHDADGDHRRHSGGEHDGDRDHHSPHHSGRGPNGIYYIYPYNQYWYGWTYGHYPRPTYPAPTYRYYCPSYAAYYPYVASCPESWMLVPAS